MNLLEEIEKVKTEGYSEANAQARVCQDIILYGAIGHKKRICNLKFSFYGKDKKQMFCYTL